MSTLSIIIPVLNDEREANLTIRSIRLTSPADRVQILVIDDQSDKPVQLEDKSVQLVRNTKRIGVAGCRHRGAIMASGEVLLFLDSHMRCEPGWFEKADKLIFSRPTTIHCGGCLGLSESNMDVFNPICLYTGATLNLCGPDRNKPGASQIFEGVWLADRPGLDDYEIPCVMGACYFVPKEFFFRIGGLASLKFWGSDEPFLSLKAWLSGGDIRLLKSVRFGHKFRDRAPYGTVSFWLIYNKLRAMNVTMMAHEFHFLASKFPQDNNFRAAMDQLKAHGEEVAYEKAYLSSVFTYDLRWFCDKFNIPYPLNT